MQNYSTYLKDLASRKDLNVYLFCTGAGAGIQNKIWNTVGCSSFFVGADMPYSRERSSEVLGYIPDKFVSVEMSVDLAMAAYARAYQPRKRTIGLGLTASVASATEHRGEHKIIVTTFGDHGCFTSILNLEKGFGDYARYIDGDLSDNFGLQALFHAAGYDVLSEDNHTVYIDTSDYAADSLIKKPFFDKFGNRSSFTNDKNYVFYPGNFNPIHEGHVNSANAALNDLARYEGTIYDVVYTTTVNPPHKDSLSSMQVMQRVSMMKNKNFLLTYDDGLYLDKAKKFPESNFIIGADALLRMLDPKWGVNIEDLLSQFVKLKAGFLVLGRLVDGNFTTLKDIMAKFPILKMYPNNFEEVIGRWDISSTEIRNSLK